MTKGSLPTIVVIGRVLDSHRLIMSTARLDCKRTDCVCLAAAQLNIMQEQQHQQAESVTKIGSTKHGRKDSLYKRWRAIDLDTANDVSKAAAAQQSDRPWENAIGAGAGLIMLQIGISAANFNEMSTSRLCIRIVLPASVALPFLLRVPCASCVSVCRLTIRPTSHILIFHWYRMQYTVPVCRSSVTLAKWSYINSIKRRSVFYQKPVEQNGLIINLIIESNRKY